MKSGNRFLRAAAVGLFAAALSGFAGIASAAAQSVDYVTAKPLADELRGVALKPVASGKLKVPTITWPGDTATVHTDAAGIFKKEGLDVELFLENDFAKQCKGVIEGNTPILRGTVGMINTCAEALSNVGTDLVVVYQLTWSNGGDVLVVRPGVNKIENMKGKTFVLQLYGPHMDLATTTLKRGNLTTKDVTLKWTKELTIPTYDTKGRLNDPRQIFAATNVDGAFVISPDAAALTSGGAEGVAGAKSLFSTKSASRVIADVYAVRGDWFDKNKGTVEKFVHALAIGQESFEALQSSKTSRQAEWTGLMSKTATLLFGSPQATADAEGALADAEWVGFTGNVGFFTGNGQARNLQVLTDEIQGSLIDLGIMNGKVAIRNANWDYTKLASGIKNVNLNAIPKPQFDATKVQQTVENKINTELDSWNESGSLYFFEVYFPPKADAFNAAQYTSAFKQALELSQTFAGALIVIEGHNAPDAINKAKKDGKSATEIAMIEQQAKNLSLLRAQKVRQAYIDYAKSKGIRIDESQFVAVGMGVRDPKFPTPATEAEWNQNRRVVFRVKAVETEFESFQQTK
jgi:ABC-type nitrate/sulfonate/bicarbonate transport systems, periplasmic components